MTSNVSHNLVEGLSIKRAIKIEQVKMLVTLSPANILIGLLLASLIAIVFSGLINSRGVQIWWGAVSASFVAYYFIQFAYKRQSKHSLGHRHWYRLVLVAIVFNGMCWGFGLTYMLSQVSIEYHIFLIILLISLAAAGITLAIRTTAYYLYELSLLAPVIVWLLAQNQLTEMILGAFLMIFMIAMWLFAYQVNRALFNALRLRLENESLAASLQQSNARLQVLNEELTQLSATDSLTQVANRRYFDSRYVLEFSRANREGTDLALIMIDVDYFKAYNDQLGHIAGDECLKQVALCIRNSLKRPTDLVARFGGEEFVVLLPSTTADGAMTLAEEMQSNVEAIKITHPSSQVSQHVTISLGVTGGNVTKDTDKDALLKKADQALYNAKAAGRNKACLELLSDVNLQQQA